MGKQKQARLAREAAEREAKAATAGAEADKKAEAVEQAEAIPNKKASDNHKPKGYSGYPSIARPQ